MIICTNKVAKDGCIMIEEIISETKIRWNDFTGHSEDPAPTGRGRWDRYYTRSRCARISAAILGVEQISMPQLGANLGDIVMAGLRPGHQSPPEDNRLIEADRRIKSGDDVRGTAD